MFTTQHPHPVARDAFGLAQIGRTSHELRGIRYADGAGGAQPAPTPATIAPTVTPQPPQFVAPISTQPAPPPAPAATPAAPAAPAATPPAEVPPKINTATGKPYTPAETQAYIATVRAEAKTNRERAEEAERTATAATERANAILKAAGFNPDGTPYTEPDPAKLAAELGTSKTSEADTKRENLVLRVAPGLGADADRLLDSRTFATKLSALKPDDREGITALVTTTIAENPTWKLNPPAAASSGGTVPTGAAPITQRRSMGEAVKAALGGNA